MKLKSILIIISSLLISCEDTKEKFGELTFDMRLPQDNNGFYLLNIDRNNWQTLHRVSGKIETNGQGVENFWVSWQSDLYWKLGDTLGYIVNRGYSFQFGTYVAQDTSYMIGFRGSEVPTTNEISYSNTDGEINNMIAPVKSMVGDTLYLSAEWFDGYYTWGIILK